MKKFEELESPSGSNLDRSNSSTTNSIDHSYQGEQGAQGEYRIVGVNNGRYMRRHPVFDSKDSIVGYLNKGFTRIGYTYGCLYVDKAKCFYFLSNRILDTQGPAYISVVEWKNSFLHGIFGSDGMRFERTHFLEAGRELTNNLVAFKLAAKHDALVMISQFRFSIVNVVKRTLVVDHSFDDLRLRLSSFSIGADFFALGFCDLEPESPPGKRVYNNQVQVFDLKSGSQLLRMRLGSGERSLVRMSYSAGYKKLACYHDDGWRTVIKLE